jgi:hypothetical protein
VNKTFRWVAVAKRPLHSEELREALAIEPSDKFLERKRLVNRMDSLISKCGDLVTLDEEDLLVQFAHHTIKEFLTSEKYSTASKGFHFRLTEVDHTAGEACVAYLNLNDFKRQVIKRPRASTTFRPRDLITGMVMESHSYTAKIGSKIARKLQRDSKMDFDLIKQLRHTRAGDGLSPFERLQTNYAFLLYARDYWLLHTTGFTERNTRLWSVWKQLVVNEHPFALKPWTIDNDGISKGPLLEYILENNHCAIFSCFREDESQAPDQIDKGHLLERASRRGKIELVKCILDSNNYRSTEATRALQAAAEGGHIDVIEKLLAAQVDINTAPAYGNRRTALQAAAEGGHIDVVERLLAVNTDVNAAAAHHNGRTAIQAAAGGGNINIVETLLIAQADVNADATYNYGRTALQAAAEGGYIDIVERLLAAQADVNAAPARDGGRTALQAAAEGGYIDVVERLLAVNADVNAAAAFHNGCTAL